MKQITFKKLLELSDEKLGMTKQYYVRLEDIEDLNLELHCAIKSISDIEITNFGKEVYLCEWKIPGSKGWINMEVKEYNKLKKLF